MKKIYIASKFSSRYRMRPIKFKLQKMGFTVLSDWIDNNPLDETLGGDYDSIGNHPDASHDIAQRDIEQVQACDIFIIDTQDESPTGGRECELGVALLSGKPYIFRVGPIRNVFHAHKSVKPFKSWEDLLIMMELI